MLHSRNHESLSVGNRIIDSEHKKLRDKIEDIAHLISAKNDIALTVACKLLSDSLSNYFVIEENIAQALNFDFTQHRLAHQNLLNKCQLITKKLLNQSSPMSNIERKECLGFMNYYLTQHIKEDSKPFKLELETQLYDFRPAGAGAPNFLHVHG